MSIAVRSSAPINLYQPSNWYSYIKKFKNYNKEIYIEQNISTIREQKYRLSKNKNEYRLII